MGSQVVLVVKNSPTNVGEIKDVGLILGFGRSPGGGHDNSLQYFCLENVMGRGTWWATVHGVTKSQNDWAHTFVINVYMLIQNS